MDLEELISVLQEHTDDALVEFICDDKLVELDTLCCSNDCGREILLLKFKKR